MLHKAWNSKEEMPYCFPRSSIRFQGHRGQNITDFDPNSAFPDYRPVAAFKSLRFALLSFVWVNFNNLWCYSVKECSECKYVFLVSQEKFCMITVRCVTISVSGISALTASWYVNKNILVIALVMTVTEEYQEKWIDWLIWENFNIVYHDFS